jgi:hypothetical protein
LTDIVDVLAGRDWPGLNFMSKSPDKRKNIFTYRAVVPENINLAAIAQGAAPPGRALLAFGARVCDPQQRC